MLQEVLKNLSERLINMYLKQDLGVIIKCVLFKSSVYLFCLTCAMCLTIKYTNTITIIRNIFHTKILCGKQPYDKSRKSIWPNTSYATMKIKYS